MKAGIDGAGAENSFGVSILLPFETPVTVMQDDPESISFHFFSLGSYFSTWRPTRAHCFRAGSALRMKG
jgi:hypothetical protein